MSGIRMSVYRAGLEALYFSGAHRALRPVVGGAGAILMLHHVRPAEPREFAPNALLEVTPDFLEQVIERVRASGFEIIALDAVPGRLAAGGAAQPFVAITFDDGYRDNLVHAYPVLKRHGVPFAIYLPTAYMEGRGELWWLLLEEAIRRRDSVTLSMRGRDIRFDCTGAAAKTAAYQQIYWWLRALTEAELRAVVRALAAEAGLGPHWGCAELCMSWNEVAELGRDPLVTFGAHSVHHYMLAKWPVETARAEMVHSKALIEARLGRPVDHFAYPVGDPTSAGQREFTLAREAGFATAVTTRPGLLYAEHGAHLTALPRVSLNGHFQSLRYLDVLLSGAAFALFNGFRKVNAA
ncbi:polysaccharide deacetylase family protein [Phreatobacter sp. AB_2022a]|uniref:polysaccharide deacetylase family protein n=1 Tax=Phreatobacter sp. AB_2022a TaxID=3003134 RepID=UPI002286F380|nr:polysaccharide deacetylase family protein [Phreatobacter sp. AB_2022a]MCZ0735457.1 polysaccharide deacetylase family protein [Phreatobacter sp. AB_2022a]